MVQCKILSYTGFILHIQHRPHDFRYTLNIEILGKRRYSIGFKFLNGVLSGKVDSPILLSLINFKVPQRTSRFSVLFYLSSCTSNNLAYNLEFTVLKLILFKKYFNFTIIFLYNMVVTL